ncbi:T9SS type A sorting domain-containing protein [bacterium]|nr:MAG: T9SS type A sorting domain-containing protein [bacterium]
MRALCISLVIVICSTVAGFGQSEWENISGNNPTNDNTVSKLLFYKGKVIALHEYLGYSTSDDLGDTWISGDGEIPNQYKISDIQFIDTTLYVTTGTNRIYVSADSGATFSEIIAPAAPFNLIRAWDRLIITKTFGSASWKSDTSSTWTDYQPVFGHFVKQGIFWNDTLFTSGSNSGAAVFFYSVDTMKTFVEQRNVGFPNALAITGKFINYKGRLLLTSATDYISIVYERIGGKWVTAYTNTEFENNPVRLYQQEDELFAVAANGLFKLDDETQTWNRLASWQVSSPRQVFSSMYVDGTTLISTAIPGYQYEPKMPQVLKSADGVTFTPVISPLGFRNNKYNMMYNDTLWVFTASDGHHFSADGGKQWIPARFNRQGGNMTPYDVTPSDTGFYAVLRDAISTTSNTTQLVEYSRDFQQRRTIQNSTYHRTISQINGTYYVTKTAELLKSTDTLKTFTSIKPAGTLPNKAISRGDTILAGNLVSYNNGTSFSVLFTGSAFSTTLGKPIFTTIVDTSFVAATESSQEGGAGVFVVKNNSNYIKIMSKEDLGGVLANQLIADGTRLFVVTERAIFFTGNLGQLVEKVAEIPTQDLNSGARIQYVNFHENTLYISRTDGLFSLDVSAYQDKPFVQLMGIENVDAYDTSRTGSFIDVRGRVLTRGNTAIAYAEVIDGSAKSEKITINELDAYPVFRIKGLGQLSFYSIRVNAIIGNDTIKSEPIYTRTAQYRFWERATSDTLQISFSDAAQLSDGRLVAVGSHKVAVSDDLGKSWTGIPESPSHLSRIVAMNGDTLLAGSTSGGFVHSFDRGETWKQVSNPRYVTGGNFLIYKMAYSAEHHVVTAVYGEREQATNNASYIIISKDGGRTWDNITAQRGLPHNRLVRSMASDPDGNLYFGIEGEEKDTVLYRSIDGAETFKGVFVDSVFDSGVNDIKWHDNKMHIITEIGIYNSENGMDFRYWGTFSNSKVLVPLSDEEYITAFAKDRRYNPLSRQVTYLERKNQERLNIVYGFNQNTSIYFNDLKRFERNDSMMVIAFTGDGIWTYRTTQNLNVSIDDDAEFANKPEDFILLKNYPNPFNPSTTIHYQLPANARVQLTVYDVLGRQVAVLVNGQLQSAGRYDVRFDASRLASGVYVYQLRAGEHVKTGKMMLIK